MKHEGGSRIPPAKDAVRGGCDHPRCGEAVHQKARDGVWLVSGGVPDPNLMGSPGFLPLPALRVDQGTPEKPGRCRLRLLASTRMGRQGTGWRCTTKLPPAASAIPHAILAEIEGASSGVWKCYL